jgi:hypothetical protein
VKHVIEREGPAKDNGDESGGGFHGMLEAEGGLVTTDEWGPYYGTRGG